MKKLGIIGQRGMVGSVLMQRMLECADFEKFHTTLFSTSQVGENAPIYPNTATKLADANNIEELSSMDILLTCQGGEYTKDIHPKLRSNGWKGYWIDAASTLRVHDKACLVLDPINMKQIEDYLDNNGTDLVGANCTVSLMLLGIHGLLKNDLVEWVSSQTYQAASGAGAKNMIELLDQMKFIGQEFSNANLQTNSALDIDKNILTGLSSTSFPSQEFGHPLALNLLPWIDSEMENGQSKEEWKAQVEANKILGTTNLKIDGTCTRVGSMRCHAQALIIKLKKKMPQNEVEQLIGTANDWVKFVPNNKTQTLKELTPMSISGTLDIGIGRLRPTNMGDDYYNAFTIGDQLLWGAAEPLRRALNILA